MTRISDLNRVQDLTDGDVFPIGTEDGSTRGVTAKDAAKYFTYEIGPIIDEAKQAALDAQQSAESAEESAAEAAAAAGVVGPQVREVLRRSYAEAGYNLIGDFSDTGLDVNSVTDVVLLELTGIAYSYSGTLPHTIGAGETPIGNPLWIDRSASISKHEALNAMWAGEFRCWQMGHALGTDVIQRVQVPAGVTHARLGFTAETTVYHAEGAHARDSMRIQRNVGNANTSSHTVVLNLTQEETKLLAGKRCVVQFNGLRSSTFSGGALAYRVQYSVEPEQPILRADGNFTNGNTLLVSGVVTLDTVARAKGEPYFAVFDLPFDAVQVAVVLTVPFSGTAGADDYIEIEDLLVYPGDRLANVLRESSSSLLNKARSRYQCSYPYGAPRGTNTEQGSVSTVAINTAVNWALSIPIRFNPPMSVVPQFIFQSPTSGTESRILNKDTGVNLNGIAFSLDETGAVITNNGAAIAGNRYLCHWTAQIIF